MIGWIGRLLGRLRGLCLDFLREAIPPDEGEGGRRIGPPGAGTAHLKSRREKDVLGRRGEQVALQFLKRERKFRILGRNVALPGGELDIVAEDGPVLVFVEVKTRRQSEDGGPVAAVGFRKRRTIARLASMYVERFRLGDRPVRFDLVSVVWPSGREPVIEYFRDAFDAPGPGGR